MTTTAVATAVKLLESLPEATQAQVVQHLREYVASLGDEFKWDLTFQRSQEQLVEAAQRARQEITQGKASPMDLNQL